MEGLHSRASQHSDHGVTFIWCRVRPVVCHWALGIANVPPRCHANLEGRSTCFMEDLLIAKLVNTYRPPVERIPYGIHTDTQFIDVYAREEARDYPEPGMDRSKRKSIIIVFHGMV